MRIRPYQAEQMIGEMKHHIYGQGRGRYPVDNPPTSDCRHSCSDRLSGRLRPDRDCEPNRAPDDLVGNRALDHDLDNAEKDIERWRRNAGIGEGLEPGVDVGRQARAIPRNGTTNATTRM